MDETPPKLNVCDTIIRAPRLRPCGFEAAEGEKWYLHHPIAVSSQRYRAQFEHSGIGFS